MPTLIERVPEPVLLTYPKVTTTAEKFEAMVQLGSRNSRMKDFHDIWALSDHLEFEGKGLQEAVLRCFERRGTPWTHELPEVLTSSLYTSVKLQDLWAAYRRQSEILHPPPNSFEDIQG